MRDLKHKEEKDWGSNAEELNNLEVENNPAKDFLYFVFDLLKTGVVVFLIAFALRYFAVQPFIVDGESMMPSYTNREYLLAEKVSYLTGEVKRGDVIILRYPKNPSVSYIKRVIALPGETIQIENNIVMIKNSENPQGVTIKEDYIPASSMTLVSNSQNGTFSQTMGPAEYFVMGDNRQHSSDSREWGVVPRGNIIGRAWLTLMPTKEFGVHKRVNYSNLTQVRESLYALGGQIFNY